MTEKRQRLDSSSWPEEIQSNTITPTPEAAEAKQRAIDHFENCDECHRLTTTYTCTRHDQTTPLNACGVNQTGGGITVTGTGRDVIRFQCVGN